MSIEIAAWSDNEPECVAVVGIGVDVSDHGSVATLIAQLPQLDKLGIIVLPTFSAQPTLDLRALLQRSQPRTAAARTGLQLAAGRVYVAEYGAQVTVHHGKLVVTEAVDSAERILDHFLCSLAADQGRHGIGVVLANVPNRGYAGLKALAHAGGCVVGPLMWEHGGGEPLHQLRQRLFGLVRERTVKHLDRIRELDLRMFVDRRSDEHAAGPATGTTTFGELQRVIGRLPELPQANQLRVWVPGCGSGEELYALSLLFAEQHVLGSTAPRPQFFGTDPSAGAVASARAAVYPSALAADLPTATRRRFFTERAGTVRVVDELRFRAVFRRHDPLVDPPFIRIGLLSCRGLLQRAPELDRPELFRRFHFALRGGGWLLVGRDQIGLVPDALFQLVDDTHGLFRTRAVQPHFAAAPGPRLADEPKPLQGDERSELLAVADQLRGLSAQRLQELEALDRAHADLLNFVEATQTLAFICDSELHVTRASSSLISEFGLGQVEPDLPLATLAAHLPGTHDVTAMAIAVQEHGYPEQRTAVLRYGRQERSYLVHVAPYRVPPFAVGGVVGVLTDVTQLDQARAVAARREHQQALIAELGLAALQVKGDDASADAEVSELCRRALTALSEALACEHALVLETQLDPNRMLLRAARGLQLQHAGPCIPVPQGSDLHAVLGLGSASMLDLAHEHEHDALQPAGPFDKHAPAAGIGCPLRVGESVVGLLALYHCDDRELGLDELHFVQAIANVLAGAIARQRAGRQLALDHGVAVTLVDARSLAELGERAGSTFERVLGEDVVELWLCDGTATTDTLQRVWPVHTTAPARMKQSLPAHSQSLVTACLTDRRPRMGRPSQQAGAELVWPIMAGDEPAGVLRVDPNASLALYEGLLAGLERAASRIGEFVHRVRLHEALQRSEHRYRAQSAVAESIYAALPVGMAIHDRKLRRLRSNHQLAQLEATVEPQPSAALGESVLRSVFESGQPARDIAVQTGPVHDPREWSFSVTPIKDSTGRVTLVSSVVQDVTEHKRIEDALRAADRQKVEFLAMLGHELRNPLSAIRNVTELLGLGSLDEHEQARVHAILDRQTHQMGQLIDGVLDVSRIARGKLTLEQTTLDLSWLLRDVVYDRSTPWDPRSPEIALMLPDEPLWVAADRVRVLQVFEHLLTNAQKFTPRTGRIAIRARAERGRAIVELEDDGLGIESELLPYVFEPFRRAPPSADHARPGLGLGLALVRGIIDLHGGSVRAHSEGKDRGSRFTVELALATEPGRASQELPSHVAALRVLVVEDHRDLAETLTTLLSRVGHEAVDSAANPELGLERARALRPHVILCDVGSPSAQGTHGAFDLARYVRRDPMLRRTHLIAISGYGSEEERTRLRKAGFDDHLIKPVALDTLRTCLSLAAKKLN